MKVGFYVCILGIAILIGGSAVLGVVGWRKYTAYQGKALQTDIFDIVTILPDPSSISHIQKIRDQLFWVLRDTNGKFRFRALRQDKDVYNHRYESWIVDTGTGTAKLVHTEETSDTLRISAMNSAGVFAVHLDMPTYREKTDFYDPQTGDLLASVLWQAGHRGFISVSKDQKTLHVSIAPPVDFVFNNEENLENENGETAWSRKRVHVNALQVNGEPFLLSAAHEVEYYPVGEGGALLAYAYPNLGKPSFTAGVQRVGFSLPWNEWVEIDLNHLDASGIRLYSQD